MNRVAGVFALLIGLLLGSSGWAIDAPAMQEVNDSGILLAQSEAAPRERKGIFRFLFRNRENRERRQVVPRRELRLVPRQERQSAPAQRERPRKQTRQRKQESAGGGAPAERPKKQRKQRKSRPAAVAPVQAKAVEKAPDAKRVVVLGDFVGGALAKGLTEAFEQNANVVVVDATKGDSGLVRADLYDWSAQIPAVMEEHKPDAVLMLVGANDRQSISTDGGSHQLGSDPWRLGYTIRVAALADALKSTTKPVLWAGLAPVKPTAMSRDYSTLNGIYREQLETRGMRYVDVWNGFADETGKYVTTGPDMNGQTTQLRTNDGLNFTKAGQRKLAFFVERELNELLGNGQQVIAAAVPTQPSNIELPDQGPRIGPMIPLDAIAVAGDTLSAGVPAAGPGQGDVAAAVTARLGSAAASPPGRVDDFAWPARPLAVPPPPPPVPLAGAPVPAGPAAGAVPTATIQPATTGPAPQPLP